MTYERELRDTWGGDAPEVLVYDGIERPERSEDKVRRNHDGRPYIRAVDEHGNVLEKEVMYSRVTTYIKCVDDTTLLNKWTMRMMALGFAGAPEHFAAQVMQWQHSRTELDKVCERAKERAAADDQAAVGTAVHALTERHDRGLPLGVVPSYYKADLVAWIDATRHFEHVVIEEMMVQDALKVAGTPDRVTLYHPCKVCGRRKYILDLKTGRVDHYTELQQAMQLGFYANSAFYNLATGERTMHDDICLDKGIVVHLPAGSGVAETHWVDIETGWQTALEVARRVREARRLAGLTYRFTPIEDLHALIDEADSRATLNRMYAEHAGIWTDEHTEHAMHRSEGLS